jgi:Met-zincin
VGHTLGLRHNFRSSVIYTDRELSDPAFTAAKGLAGSVMEYAPINLPRPGQTGGTPFQTVLGPYDYWAIEYAYKPMPPGTTAEQERAELQRIAARSAEPQLAYGTDEDNFIGIDPESLVFDLGPDPMAFAEKRIAIARDLLARQEGRALDPKADYSVLRRSINYAVRDAGRSAGILARQIGGVRTLRDHPGSGRDPLSPVPAAQQRQALDVLARGVLSADAFVLTPALQRKLAPDFSDRTAAVFEGGDPGSTDYSIIGLVLGMQRALLAQLMSDGVASRLLDSEGKIDRTANGAPGDTFRLSELYGRLSREIWSELSDKGDIPAPRRELQREHANRLASQVLRPGVASRADSRSLLRTEAQALLARIERAAKRPGLSDAARAHLADSADTLSQALAAKLQRAGV